MEVKSYPQEPQGKVTSASPFRTQKNSPFPLESRYPGLPSVGNILIEYKATSVSLILFLHR